MSGTPILAKASLNRGKAYCLEHNRRTYDRDKWNKDGHIDYSRTHLNEYVKDYSLAEFVDKIMGDALIKSDDKNWKSHPERVIGMSKDEYYKTLSEKTEKYGEEKGKEAADHIRRDRAIENYLKKEKSKSDWIPVEINFKLGNHDDYYEMIERVADGLSEKEIKKSGMTKKQLAQSKVDDFYKGYYEALIKKFEEDNPTLRVFGAYIHMDETVIGGPELHLDYIPVTEQKKGLTVKINNAGAFKELGYPDKGFASQITAWTNDYRKEIEAFAQDYCTQHYKDMWFILPSEKCDRPHKSQHQHNAEQAHKQSVKGMIGHIFEMLKTGSKKEKDEAAQYIVDNFETIKAVAEEKGQKELEKAHRLDMYNQIQAQIIKEREDKVSQREQKETAREQINDIREKVLQERECHTDAVIRKEVRRRTAPYTAQDTARRNADRFRQQRLAELQAIQQRVDRENQRRKQGRSVDYDN